MMLLLTGGSACGKSSYAEALCARLPKPRYYIAAMRPADAEDEEKIAKHRAMRKNKGFETIERYTGLSSLRLPVRGTALLECICNLTANEMFYKDGAFTDPCAKVIEGVRTLYSQCAHLIVVTNDVGSDGCVYDAATSAYIAAIGTINAALAAQADAVYEMVCGIPLVRKGVLLG